MKRRTLWVLGLITTFGVAMGFFEATVVVYLREIAYPDGFSFPLVRLGTKLAAVEVAREFASLVMIASVARLAAQSAAARLSCFMIIFGVWDILYYVFLKLILGWPSSLLETDILFLIPVPWVGPILAPVIVSMVMMAAGIATLRQEDRGKPIRLTPRNIAPIVAGALMIIISFCLDWRSIVAGGLPGPFAWWLFLAGLGPAIGVFLYELRTANMRKSR